MAALTEHAAWLSQEEQRRALGHLAEARREVRRRRTALAQAAEKVQALERTLAKWAQAQLPPRAGGATGGSDA